VDGQAVLVLLAVAAALAYLGRRAWRTWAGGKAGCAGGCGCASARGDSPAGRPDGALVSADQLTLRARRRRLADFPGRWSEKRGKGERFP
jgi:hypothetical protein